MFIIRIVFDYEVESTPVVSSAEGGASNDPDVIGVRDPSHHIDMQLSLVALERVLSSYDSLCRECNLQLSRFTGGQFVGNNLSVPSATLIRSFHRQFAMHQIDPASRLFDCRGSTADIRDIELPYERLIRVNVSGNSHIPHVRLLQDDVSYNQLGALSEG